VIQSKSNLNYEPLGDLRLISDKELETIMQGKDSADKGMSYLSSCVFFIKNFSKEDSKRISKLIALGGGCLLSGKPTVAFL